MCTQLEVSNLYAFYSMPGLRNNIAGQMLRQGVMTGGIIFSRILSYLLTMNTRRFSLSWPSTTSLKAPLRRSEPGLNGNGKKEITRGIEKCAKEMR